MGARGLQPRRHAAADPDRAGPGAPVSAGLQQEPELHRFPVRRRRLRPPGLYRRGAGAARAAAPDQDAAGAVRPSGRLHPADLVAARLRRRAVPGPGNAGLLPVAGDAQQRPVRGRGRSHQPAPRLAGRAVAAQLRRGGAAGDRQADPGRAGNLPAARILAQARGHLPRAGAGEPVAPDAAVQFAQPARPAVPRLPRAGAGAVRPRR